MITTVKVKNVLPDGTTVHHIRYKDAGWYFSSNGPQHGPMIWGPWPTYEEAKTYSKSKKLYYDVPDLIFEVL